MTMIRYSSNSRKDGAFRSDVPITDTQIRQHAPSILAMEPHSSRANTYAFIPTLKVLDGLRAQGFEPFEVRQTKCRNADRREFTRHMLRLRHPDLPVQADGTPEIILLNSHDGTSSYQLMSGFFRFVCSNGLIAGSMLHDIRIRHTGNVVNDVIEGSFSVIEDTKQLVRQIDTYRAVELKPAEQQALASAALSLRWGESAPIEMTDLLEPQRREDKGDDLWSVFNRIQEHVLVGGIRGQTQTGKRLTTRAVGGVNENVKLNRALWVLADEMAKLKLDASRFYAKQ